MAITLERDRGIRTQTGEQLGLECPYCGVYAHMTPQSVPDTALLMKDKPKHVGLVYQCDSCHAPIFLRDEIDDVDDRHPVNRQCGRIDRLGRQVLPLRLVRHARGSRVLGARGDCKRRRSVDDVEAPIG